MTRFRDYRCTRCGTPTARGSLVVKKVSFARMGEGAKLIRSRVLDWLCPSCTVADPDWNRPANQTPTRSISG